MEQVTYSSSFALGLKMPDGFVPPVSWTAMYVDDNPCVRFLCFDAKKRGLGKFDVNWQ